MAKDQSSVEYREIPGFPGYRVGNDGSVWSQWRTRPGGRFISKWHTLKPSPTSKGYCRVNLTDANGSVRCWFIHVLILTIFVGPCPPGQECRHINGIKTDNRLNNLCWGTPEQNRDDNHRFGVYGKGETHTQSKLTSDQVREIRSRRAAGESLNSLAASFGVRISNISSIARRRSWKHVE